jgi:hypothetical protein
MQSLMAECETVHCLYRCPIKCCACIVGVPNKPIAGQILHIKYLYPGKDQPPRMTANNAALPNECLLPPARSGYLLKNDVMLF